MTTHNLVTFASVQEDLLGQLELARDVVVHGDEQAAASVARSELPRFVAGLRALVERHQPDADGFCQECRTGRWWRRPRVPCQVLLEFRLAMLDSDTRPLRPSKHRAE